MKKRLTQICLLGLVIATAVLVGSCKQEDRAEELRRFNPEIDGVAVRQMPEMDLETAREITNRGTYDPFAGGTSEEIAAAAENTAPVETTEPVENTEDTTEREFDPNDPFAF